MAEANLQTDLLAVLDQCIADVRAERKTIERCLDEYPEHRTELAALLPTAAAIIPASVMPDQAQKLRARYALVESIHRESQGSPGLLGRLAGLRRGLAGVAAAVVLATAGSGAAVVAAQDAQPTDPLYGLKTAVEQQQLALASSPEARAHLRVRIASRRLSEAERAIDAGREDIAVAAAIAYGEMMQRAYSDIETAGAGSGTSPAASDAASDIFVRVPDVAAKARMAGEETAAVALLDARERAERERPAAQHGSPPRPAAKPAPTAEVRLVVDASAIDLAGDEPDGLLENEEILAPEPATPVSVQASAPPAAGRIAPAQPTSPPDRGSVNQGIGQGQRAGPGGNDRGNEQSGAGGRDAGRPEGNQPGAGAAPQVQPSGTPVPTRTAVPTATLRPVVNTPGDREDGDGVGASGTGRGNDEGRGRPTSTGVPTAIPRVGASNESGPRPMATATPRASSEDEGRERTTPTRTGSSGNNGNGDRDRDGRRGSDD
jgi:hypothetical protein